MGCNPCCCWKLKDAAITIGIWSVLYSMVSLGLFTWQSAVLAECRHVTMAQSNLQCEYYCPCVGASTARTSSIVEGLFVIQILCLITSFFLLFTSLSLIYGVHTWSQFLVWPWFICMASSILTSLAYCIMWWAGDVRDYWLVLTILEAFGIFLNCYCFVVICVFYKRMQIELEYYEGRRAQKYDRFSHQATPRMNEFDDDDFRGDYPYPYRGGPAPYDWPQGEYRYNGGTVSKYPPDPLPSYLQQQQPQPQQQLQQQQQFTQQQPQTYVAPQPPPSQQQQQQQQQPFITQKYDPIIPAATQPQAAAAEPFERPRSSATQSAAPFDDFYDVPRQEHQRSLRHRSERRHCHHHHHRHHHRSASQRRKRHHSGGASTSADPHRHHHHHHHHHLKPSHHNHQRDCDCHHYGRHCRRGAAIASCSSDCSGTESTTTASTSHYANMTTLERRGRLTRTLSRLSDEAEDDGIGVDSDEVGESAADKLAKRQSLKRRKSARKGARNLPTTAQPLAAESIPPSTRSRLAADDDAASSVAADPLAGGITIPQHIVIPPSALIGGADGAGGPNAERKYQINSEITIHYDPRRHRVEQSSRDNASEAGSGLQSLLRNQPTSITSNV